MISNQKIEKLIKKRSKTWTIALSVNQTVKVDVKNIMLKFEINCGSRTKIGVVLK